jgi:MEMO1 family protein
MRTPLGDVDVDAAALERTPEILPDARAHAKEHSIEVELPFLQTILPHATVIPLAVGRAEPRAVADILAGLWDDETLLVVSSDLSHYLPHEDARRTDLGTAGRILSLDGPLDAEEACGAAGINGLLVLSRERNLRPDLLDLRSSGDTAGPRDRVVGYGAFAFSETTPS